MEGERERMTDIRIEQVRSEMLEFTKEVRQRQQGNGKFTFNEVEVLLSRLRSKTDSIYLDLVSDIIAETDEKDLIKSKKGSAGSKE